jgi:prepilin-type N-terminal cleavage/methylation domain-containing protein
MQARRDGMQLTRRDDGFTLVELLISIAILGVIAFPLGNVVISYLHNTDATTARLSESHDAQIAATYWAQDVAGIGTRDWGGTYPFDLQPSVWQGTGPGGAGISNPCTTAGTTVVQFSADYITGSFVGEPVPQNRVAYVVETLSGERQLHRLTCTADSPSGASSAPTSDAVLVHNLDAAGADTAVAAVSCYTTLAGSPISCTAAVPPYVKLVLTINSVHDTDGPYVVTLTGQRRQT